MGCAASKDDEEADAPMGTAVVMHGTLIKQASSDGVPQRTKAFFHKLDKDNDNCVTLEELQTGFEKEFESRGGLMPHAKEAIKELFEAHAAVIGEPGLFSSGQKALKPGSFNRFYAEILFRHFDANNNGYLELNEAENALRFLCKNKSDGSKADPVNVVYPVDAYVEGELRLPKSWFFSMYRGLPEEQTVVV